MNVTFSFINVSLIKLCPCNSLPQTLPWDFYCFFFFAVYKMTLAWKMENGSWREITQT
jgi:hypothetical protein